MKILKKDLRSGLITLKLENPDDGWKLESILEEGDLISGKTMRSTEIVRGDKRERGGKKPAFLKIILEKKEFHEYSGKLRLTGKIIEGPEETLGSYHTFGVGEGTVITIEKKWKRWQLEKLKRSQIKHEKVIVCVMDERDATIAEVGEKVKIISEVRRTGGKQFGESDSKGYFGEIISILRRKGGKIILAGPGFAKEDLYKQLDSELSERIVIETCSHTGKTGIQEIIRRGAIEKVRKGSRITEETNLVEEFLGELAKDGLVTYGEKEVESAVEMGAVKKLLVSEKKIREFEKIMEKAEQSGAEVFIISEKHESGQKLYNLGGIAAFLRFKVNQNSI